GGQQFDQTGRIITDTPAFRAWFGNSRVVDENGAPLVVYHGSVIQGLNEIKPGTREPGAWFTRSLRYANDYAKGPEGEIYEVFLSIQNPMVVRFDAEGMPIVDGEPLGADNNVDIVKLAQKRGYDGVHFPDGNFSEESEAWVAFHPEQIKSATGNRGTFDPSDPNILHQFAGPQAATADAVALDTAKARIEAGEDAEAVRQATGWFKGADGKWRFEISDADAKLKKPYPSKGQRWGDVWLSQLPAGSTLGKMLDHPALFAAYPSLADIPVTTKKGMGASYSVASRQIDLGEDVPMYDALSILLHEIQHVIQNIEGFASGGNAADAFADPRMRPGATREGLAAARRLLNERLMAMAAPMPIEQFAREAWGQDEVTPELQASYDEYVQDVTRAS